MCYFIYMVVKCQFRVKSNSKVFDKLTIDFLIINFTKIHQIDAISILLSIIQYTAFICLKIKMSKVNVDRLFNRPSPFNRQAFS